MKPLPLDSVSDPEPSSGYARNSAAQRPSPNLSGIGDEPFNEKVARTMESMEGTSRIASLENDVRLWATKDPESAAAWVASLPRDYRREAALYALLHGWTERDPAAAAAWLGQFPENREYAAATAALADAWSNTDPAAALNWAEKLSEDSHASFPSMTIALQRLAAMDPAAASDWLARQTAHPRADQFAAAIARGIAAKDPAAGIAWAQQLSDPSRRWLAFTHAFNAYSEQKPSEAARMLVNLPTQQNPSQHFESLMRHWGTSDYSAALSWTRSLPAGEMRHSAWQHLGDSIAVHDPTAAISAYQQIPDLDLRDSLIMQTYEDWVLDYPEQANTWLDQSGLPQELIHKIRNPEDE